ncbi:hypothetical protein B0H14DRAFT_2958089, partial [Mycena olivaceomarginata]
MTSRISGDFVAIFHPGYTPARLLLRLPCLDNNGTGNGVLFSVVLDAAYVLANNTHGTFKTIISDHSTGSGSELTLNLDELLPAALMPIMPPARNNYRVCLNFKAWSPPESLPSTWGAVQFRGSRCCRTTRSPSELDGTGQKLTCLLGYQHRDGLRTSLCALERRAHVFPSHTLQSTIPHIYGGCERPNQPVTMRADIGSTVFDQLHFVIVPINGQCPEHIYSSILAMPRSPPQNLESNKKRKVSHPWSFATETGNNSLEHPPADAVQFAESYDSSGIGPVLDEGNTDREQLVYVNALAGTKFAGLCDLDDELGPEGGIRTNIP